MAIFYKEDYKLGSLYWAVFFASAVICGFLSVWLMQDIERIAFSILFATCLALASIIDWKHGIIPDFVNMLILLAGMVMVVRLAPINWPHHFIGGILGYAIIRIIEIVYKKLRKRDGIGQGDAKMFGAIGVWVAWSGLPFVMLIASVSSLITVLVKNPATGKPNKNQLAFAPGIALGSWTVWLFELGKQFV